MPPIYSFVELNWKRDKISVLSLSHLPCLLQMKSNKNDEPSKQPLLLVQYFLPCPCLACLCWSLYTILSFFKWRAFYIAFCILTMFPSDPLSKGVCPLSPLVFHFLNRSCRFFWIESFYIALFYTGKGTVVWRNAGMKCIYCEALSKCFMHNNICKRAC